jgi:hypothetical protein
MPAGAKPAWMEDFQKITGMTHTEQGIWWLNGFWKEKGCGQDYAETMWKEVHLAIEMEAGKPKMYGSKVWEVKEGCDLDEFKAHNFLEKLGGTMTVVELRKKLAALDIDKNNKMAMSEYLLGKFLKKPEELIKAPQGGQAEASKLEAAKRAVAEAAAALNQAVAREEASAKAAKEAEKALWASEAAKAELAAAVAELEAQEKALKDKKAGYQAKIDDPNLSAMKVGTAKNELAQLEAEDPLPLRKAKITQGAALKKAERAAKLAAEEKEAADVAAANAVEAKAAAERAFAEAEKQLDELKRKGDGIAQGAVWWMERELIERRKYMPKK